MKRMMGLALGLFFGAMVGVALVLLFTPQSGSELQKAARKRFEEILEEARRAGAARRMEIAQQFPIAQSSAPSEEVQ
jgi:gas vesicle protein